MVFFLFLLGLVFGSFIGALSYRYPRRISIKKGRSFCPNCKHQIAWYDNIPLLSYIFLGGRCRNCKRPISWRYPAIEAATAVGFAIIFFTSFNQNFVQGLFILFMFLVLELIFIVDLEHRIIPDDFIFSGLLVSFLYLLLISAGSLLFTSLFSGFLAAALLLLIHLFSRGRGMGLGDVKFAILGGFLVDIKLMLIWLFLAFLTGAVTGIILILGRKAGLKDHIAFGPFLVIALPLAEYFGKFLLRFVGF